MKKILLLCLCIGILSGCVTTTGQQSWTYEERQNNTTRQYNKGYEQVFEAVVQAFDRKGYPLAVKDMDSGRIESIAISSSDMFASGNKKYYIDITKIDDTTTKVKAYISVNAKANSFIADDMYMTDADVGKSMYDAFFKAVEQYL